VVEEDRELEELRRRRLLELQRHLLEQERAAEERMRIEVQKQAVLRRILTPAARQRLANLKLVKPEFAEQVELQLIQAAQAGRLPIPLTDEQLKRILLHLQSGRRDIRIRRL